MGPKHEARRAWLEEVRRNQLAEREPRAAEGSTACRDTSTVRDGLNLLKFPDLAGEAQRERWSWPEEEGDLEKEIQDDMFTLIWHKSVWLPQGTTAP